MAGACPAPVAAGGEESSGASKAGGFHTMWSSFLIYGGKLARALSWEFPIRQSQGRAGGNAVYHAVPVHTHYRLLLAGPLVFENFFMSRSVCTLCVRESVKYIFVWMCLFFVISLMRENTIK